MLPIKALYDNVIPPPPPPPPPPLFLSFLSERGRVQMRRSAVTKSWVSESTPWSIHTFCRLICRWWKEGFGGWEGQQQLQKLDLGLPAVDHIITDILIDVSKAQRQEGRQRFQPSSRAGMNRLLLSAVRRKLNRPDDHERSARVYQPHHCLCSLNSERSSPTRKGCWVGEGLAG